MSQAVHFHAAETTDSVSPSTYCEEQQARKQDLQPDNIKFQRCKTVLYIVYKTHTHLVKV